MLATALLKVPMEGVGMPITCRQSLTSPCTNARYTTKIDLPAQYNMQRCDLLFTTSRLKVFVALNASN